MTSSSRTLSGVMIGQSEGWRTGLHATLREFGEDGMKATEKVALSTDRVNQMLDSKLPKWHEADETPYYRSREKAARQELASVNREIESSKILDEEDEVGIVEMRSSPGKTLTTAADGSAREISSAMELAKLKQAERDANEFESCVFGAEANA